MSRAIDEERTVWPKEIRRERGENTSGKERPESGRTRITLPENAKSGCENEKRRRNVQKRNKRREKQACTLSARNRRLRI